MHPTFRLVYAFCMVLYSCEDSIVKQNPCGDDYINLWGHCYSINSTDELILNSTNISAPIPEGICDLINLEYIDLSNCRLNGDFPQSIDKLQNLEYLNLSSNQMQIQIELEE